MSVQQITCPELARRLQAGEPTLLLDVRQPGEYALAALPGSVLIPLPELRDRLDEIEAPAGGLVVVYCHHGIRSLTGAVLLEQAGITPAASLAGGIDAWSVLIDRNVPRY